jgi:hypothetical protein
MTLEMQLTQEQMRDVFDGIASLANPNIPSPKEPVNGHGADDVSQRRHLQYGGQQFTFETSIVNKPMALMEGGSVYVMITRSTDGTYNLAQPYNPPNGGLIETLREIKEHLRVTRDRETKKV